MRWYFAVTNLAQSRLRLFGRIGLPSSPPRKLPAVSSQALRHSHASALIASGIDAALTASRRIGHASPVVTLSIYSHLFSETDKTAAKAIKAAMRTDKER